jgi:hypothetical protein
MSRKPQNTGPTVGCRFCGIVFRPEPEADSEDLAPEPEHLKVQRIIGLVVAAVADDQEDRQADRQRREGHVEGRRGGELPPGQVDEGLGRHLFPFLGRPG